MSEQSVDTIGRLNAPSWFLGIGVDQADGSWLIRSVYVEEQKEYEKAQKRLNSAYEVFIYCSSDRFVLWPLRITETTPEDLSESELARTRKPLQ